MTDLPDRLAQSAQARFSDLADAWTRCRSWESTYDRDMLKLIDETINALSYASSQPSGQIPVSNFSPGDPVEVRKIEGEIDEIVIRRGDVHIEQMSDDNWFMGINASDGSYWQFWFGAKNRKSHVAFTHCETVPAAENQPRVPSPGATSGQNTEREQAFEECAALLQRWADDAGEFINSERCRVQHNVCRNAAIAIRNLAKRSRSPGASKLDLGPENDAFHRALAKYPEGWKALHYFWNEVFAGQRQSAPMTDAVTSTDGTNGSSAA